MKDFDSHSMSLDPDLTVYGIVAKKCKLFTSATKPVKITMNCKNKNDETIVYNAMFKIGDDLR